MIRKTFRNSLVLSCLVTLGLLHLLMPSHAQQTVALDAKILDAFEARSVGPATMTGRIVDIEGVESNPKIVYIAAASGGLLKTTDGGETFTLLFDKESSVSIGDVAVSKSNPDIVWVGTGEHNVRNSVAWGDGVYKSEDGGKTWKNMGLKDSHTIGRIAIHPTNPDIVYVGAIGHIWGPNKERGVFKTTDGGKTWEVSKFIDEDTGFIDLKMDPSDPNVLYGAAYRMRRDAFSGSDNPSTFFLGAQAGIYKTSDGGKSWEQLKVAGPTSQYGRCGIDIYAKNPKIVYVIAQTEKTPVGEANQGGANAPGGRPEMGGVYRTDDGGITWNHQNTICPRPFYYGQVRVDPNDENRVWVLGVNTVMSTDGGKTFGGKGGGGKKGGDDPAKKDDPTKKDDKKKDDVKKDDVKKDDVKKDDVKKDDVKKDDVKKDDKKKNLFPFEEEQKQDDQKKADPQKGDPKKDDPQGKGKGGGGGGGGVHSDHHGLWVNPKDSKEVWIATDGGFGISNNGGQSYRVPRPINFAQFYGISVDSSKPYYIYGGLQDNGSTGGPSATYDEHGIPLNTWGGIGIGGDGFHTLSDPKDPNILFGESQYGGFSKGTPRAPGTTKAGGGKGGKGGFGKGDDPAKGDPKKDDPKKDEKKKDEQKKDEQKKDEQKKDDPKKDDPKKDDPKKGDPQKGGKGGGGAGGPKHKPLGVRWNWSSPMAMSPHDSKIIYYGGAYLLQSESGTNWKKISPDLTYAPADGKVKNWRHTLFTVAESPKKKGVIWTGADDGRIMVTQDGGANWNESKLPGIPKEGCVSRVEPSNHADGTCYVSVTRYRNDDRKPYIFKTTDFGKTWTNITSNLVEADGSVHVVIESSRNPSLLFCGTEFGLFTSLNGGASWNKMKAGMPTVSVHDIIIHPRERDLVVGTHGRSVYVIDDISPLEQMTAQVAAKPAHVFPIRPAVAYKPRSSMVKPKSSDFVGKNPPYGALINYYLRGPASDLSITVHDSKAGNKQIATLKADGSAGMHRAVWNLRADGQEGTVAPGDYLVVFRAGGSSQGQNVTVEAEPAPPK